MPREATAWTALARLFAALRLGNTRAVLRPDSLGRSVRQWLALTELLKEQPAYRRSLHNSIDATTRQAHYPHQCSLQPSCETFEMTPSFVVFDPCA